MLVTIVSMSASRLCLSWLSYLINQLSHLEEAVEAMTRKAGMMMTSIKDATLYIEVLRNQVACIDSIQKIIGYGKTK